MSAKGDDDGDGVAMPGEHWCEPFCVETWERDEPCEEKDCDADTRWQIEVMGWAGKSDRPDTTPPTFWVCDKHVTTVMDRWT